MFAFLKSCFSFYFSERDYILIYIHKGLHSFAGAAIYAFTGAYFLKLGMPLPYVLLFFGIEFGLRGFLCPYGVALINKIGVVRSLLLVSFFFTLFFLMMSFSQDNIWIGFSSLIFFAMGGGIYYPLYDIIEAIYVKDHVRGRQYTFSQVSQALMSMIGVTLFGFLITQYSYSVAALPILFVLFLSVLPFLILQKKIDKIPNFKAHDIYPFLANEFRPYMLTLFGFQLIIIASAVVAPLFLYSIIGKMDTLGLLIAAAICVNVIVTLIFGHYIDAKGTRSSFKPAVAVNWLCMVSLILFVKTPLSAFFAESTHKISRDLLQSSIITGLHRQFDKDKAHPLFFGAGIQMSLCFFELITLPLYAVLAIWLGETIFYVAFAGSMVGAFLSAYYFWKTDSKKESKEEVKSSC